MTALLYGSFFALGAVIASFVGLVVARYATGGKIVSGRSHCDACGVVLSPRALVPMFSYMLSSGRARCCGTRLAPSAPIAEAALGTLFALAYHALGLSPALPFFLVALAALLAMVEYDLAHQIIPPPFLAVFTASAAAAGIFSASSPHAFAVSALTALSFAAFFALLTLLSRGRLMGLADAPTVFALALLVGDSAVPGFVFSFWIGAVIGIGMLYGRPRGSRMGIEVPLVPFLAAGFLLAYFTQWNPF